MKNMGYGNGRIPNNGKKWDSGMGGSRTMKKIGYGNGTVPKNGK